MNSPKGKNVRIIKAVLANDKSNVKKAKAYEFYKDENRNYNFVIEAHVDGYQVYNAILNKFNQKDKDVQIDLDSFMKIVKEERQQERLLMSLISALTYCASIPFTMKTTKQEALRFTISGDAAKKFSKQISEYKTVAEAQTFTRKLQDTPNSIMNPAGVEKAVKAQFKGMPGVKISVLTKAELAKKGMGSLLSVGQGCNLADNAQRLLVVEYKGNPSSKKSYGFVGKGVCFDSGGYNIKTAGHMR